MYDRSGKAGSSSSIRPSACARYSAGHRLTKARSERVGPSPLLLRVQSAAADPVAVIIEDGRVDAPAVGRPELLGEDVAIPPADSLDLEPDAPAVVHPGEACYRHGFLMVRVVRIAPQRRERRLECVGEIDAEGGQLLILTVAVHQERVQALLPIGQARDLLDVGHAPAPCLLLRLAP